MRKASRINGALYGICQSTKNLTELLILIMKLFLIHFVEKNIQLYIGFNESLDFLIQKVLGIWWLIPGVLIDDSPLQCPMNLWFVLLFIFFSIPWSLKDLDSRRVGKPFITKLRFTLRGCDVLIIYSKNFNLSGNRFLRSFTAFLKRVIQVSCSPSSFISKMICS